VTPSQLPAKRTPGSWVQTDRATHEAWAQLAIRHPAASGILHFLAAQVGDELNAVVISQGALADATGMSLSTVKRALAVLQEGNWIESWRVGPTGTAAAYVLNDRVVWTKSRDDLRYSLFSAAVYVSAKEQQAGRRLENKEPLRKLPRMFPRERQLPTGDGLPPPSQPSLPNMEPDLPSLSQAEAEQTDIEDWMAPRRE